MIRFTDVATDAKPKKAATPDVKTAPAQPAADTPKPAKAPRKPKKSA